MDNEMESGLMQIGQQHSLATGSETALAASASQAKAMVEARFIMAIHRPRDMDAVRLRVLKDCKRPGFAETARYRRPVGKKKNEDTGRWEESYVEGPSIRFAEAAVRAMGNIDIQTPIIYDDEEKRIVRCSATDLETNATWSKDFTISKTVERRNLKQNQKPLGTRQNSYGETVYIVHATDSEVEVKTAAEISKAVRTLGLRLVPGDILDEAMFQCVATLRNADASDPDAARKKMVDAFDSIGVKPSDLRVYMEHDVGSCSPAELAELRALYTTIKEGATTWVEVMRTRQEGVTVVPQDGDKTSRANAAKDAVKNKAKQSQSRQPGDDDDQPPMGALSTDPKPGDAA